MPKVVFYRDRRGAEPARDYLLGLSREAERAAVARHVRLLAERGETFTALGMIYARLIDRRNRIYELRPGPHRIAYAEYTGTFVLLHAWRKQTQKLDRRALQVAQHRLYDWIARHEP